MEQNVNENDMLYLKLKYFNLFNLNNQTDNQIRINQIYEQAKWSILSEEIECTDEELIQFAGLQLQIQVQTKLAAKVNAFNHNLTQDTNDIDAALDKLEKDLKLNNTNTKTLFNDVPEIGEEIELMKPKYTFKKFKIYYFQLKETYLSYFKSKEDLLKKSKPLDKLNLKDSHLIPDLNVKSQKFCLSLKINDLACGNTQELYMRFSTQQSYVKWVAAFKLASKNKTIADLDDYQFEIESINNLIEMQKKPSPNTQSHNSLDTSLGDFQSRNFVTHRLFKKMKTKQVSRIIFIIINCTQSKSAAFNSIEI
jgi:kindlin 2